MADTEKPVGDEPKAKKKHHRGRKGANQRRAKLLKAVAAGKTMVEAAVIAGYSDKYPAQSAYQALKPIRPVVLNIIKEAGYPIEKIFSEHILPKLHAKKVTHHAHQGIVMETKYDEADDIQLRAGLEIARMTGCYAPEKVEVDVEHTFKVDLRNATDDDLLKIIGLAEGTVSRPGSEGRVLQKASHSVVARD